MTRASPPRSRCVRACSRRPRRTSPARSKGSGTIVGRRCGTRAARRFLDSLDISGPGGAIGRMAEGEGKDEAKEVGMRHAVDYAGRVAEPYLKRAKVEREKSVGRPR